MLGHTFFFEASVFNVQVQLTEISATLIFANIELKSEHHREPSKVKLKIANLRLYINQVVSSMFQQCKMIPRGLQ